MKNKSLTPQIRFKGYEDEWVSRPFSEIVTRYSLLKYDETIPSVEYEDINSKKVHLIKTYSVNQSINQVNIFKLETYYLANYVHI